MRAQSWTGVVVGSLLLAAGLLSAQAPKEGAAGKDGKQLAGTWRAATYALDGKEATAADLKDIRLLIDADGKFKAQNAGQTFLAGTVQTDPDKKPRTMDITYTEGDLKGQTSRAIYELDGDTLRICRAAPGKARPTEFASKPGSGLTLMTYQRGKPSDKKK
jgi:uncharacterized protein (TIGR03067 family)